jgi:hypothetical protein
MKLNRILYLLILCLFFNGNFSISRLSCMKMLNL